MSFLLILSLILTVAHVAEEYHGRLWRYFGSIAGVWIPHPVGIVSFSIGLLALLSTLAVIGFSEIGSFSDSFRLGAVFALIGGRLGDVWFSHWRLALRHDWISNPGFRTSFLYFAEGMMLLIVFRGEIAANFGQLLLCFAAGAGFFWSVIPSLHFLHHVGWPLRTFEPGSFSKSPAFYLSLMFSIFMAGCAAAPPPPDPAILAAQARVYEAVAAKIEARMSGEAIAPPSIPTAPVSFVERIPLQEPAKNPIAGREFRLAPSQPLATIPPLPSDE